MASAARSVSSASAHGLQHALALFLVEVRGQALHVAAAPRPHLPAVFAEALAEQRHAGQRRVAPKVALVIGAPGHFLEVEAFGGIGGAAVRQPQQETRQREPDEARLRRVPQRLPQPVARGVRLARRAGRAYSASDSHPRMRGLAAARNGAPAARAILPTRRSGSRSSGELSNVYSPASSAHGSAPGVPTVCSTISS